jgi:hypothetical protein
VKGVGYRVQGVGFGSWFGFGFGCGFGFEFRSGFVFVFGCRLGCRVWGVGYRV